MYVSVHITNKLNIVPLYDSRTCFISLTQPCNYLMFLVALVCLFVCQKVYSKSYERIGMKFYGGVLGSTMKN